MRKWIKKHKVIFVFICLLITIILFGIPFLINLLFKINSDAEIFQAEWSAGEALSYYGAILSFIGTVVLGALALYQNHIIKQEADKKAYYLEQKEKQENMPKFIVDFCGANGGHSNYGFTIKNVSNNIATDIQIDNIELKNSTGSILWKAEKTIVYSCLVEETRRIDLKNPVVKNDDEYITMTMVCKDKYEDLHTYNIKILFEGEKSKPIIVEKCSV